MSREDIYPPEEQQEEHWQEHAPHKPRHRRSREHEGSTHSGTDVRRPQRRKTWPWLLGGCATGVLAAALVAAIIILLTIRNINGGTGIIGIGSLSTFTDQSQQMVPVSGITQVQIHN